MTTPTPFGYFDLIEAFAQPGCAICRLLERDVSRFLDTLLYEHPTDPISQNNFRASRGLCHKHTWMLPSYNSALTTAVLYNAVIDELLQISASTAPDQAQGRLQRRLMSGGDNALAAALAADRPCPACVVRDKSEAIFVEVLGQHVTETRMRAVFTKSEGLCLPHFQAALRASRDAETARLIAGVQRDQWQNLKQELEMFMHKMDAHYHQNIGEEGTSWLRALARVAGEKDRG